LPNISEIYGKIVSEKKDELMKMDAESRNAEILKLVQKSLNSDYATFEIETRVKTGESNDWEIDDVRVIEDIVEERLNLMFLETLYQNDFSEIYKED
jgi:hypothetical protein